MNGASATKYCTAHSCGPGTAYYCPLVSIFEHPAHFAILTYDDCRELGMFEHKKGSLTGMTSIIAGLIIFVLVPGACVQALKAVVLRTGGWQDLS